MKGLPVSLASYRPASTWIRSRKSPVEVQTRRRGRSHRASRRLALPYAEPGGLLSLLDMLLDDQHAWLATRTRGFPR